MGSGQPLLLRNASLALGRRSGHLRAGRRQRGRGEVLLLGLLLLLLLVSGEAEEEA